jgi:hypothetical protein
MTRRALFTCAVFLAVGAAVALVHGDPGHPARRTGGPLACEDCGRSATAVPVHIGEPVSMGPLFLRNETDKSIRIERVELLGVDAGLELIGLLAVEPDGRHPLVGGDRGFPPPGSGGFRHPVPGYELAPARTRAAVVQILFGLRLTTPGRAGARRIAVDYRVGDVPYRAYFDHSMWLCTPRYRKICIDPSW